MMEVTLYSRVDCHLCDEAREDLAALQSEYPHRLVVLDVDSQPELRRKFGEMIPVVEVGPYQLKAPISRQDLQVTLGAAMDRQKHIDDLWEAQVQADRQAGRTWTKADSFTHWFTRHYMAVFNLFVLIYVGLPVLAPVLMASGYDGPARLIYRAYGMVCHQLAYRSFFLFGEQAVYPRRAAEVGGVLTFNQATGISEGSSSVDLFAAREFIGNDQVGYKIALCERDVAIYGGILLFGLLFALIGRRWPALPWYLWILVGLVPVGLDGLSQLLSQPPFSFWEFRESPPLLRTFTGFLFGFTTAWFGYPMVEQSMAESRLILSDKLKRMKRLESA